MDAHSIMIVHVHQSHRVYAGIATHRVPRVYLHWPTATNHHNSAKLRQYSKVLSKIHIRQHLQDNVDAASAGQRLNLIEIVVGVMIENVVRSLVSDACAPLLCPTGSYNNHSTCASYLNRRDTNSTRRAVNENDLSGARQRAVKERTICSRIRDTDSSALLKGNLCRQTVHLRFSAYSLLSVCTAHGSRYIHEVADGNERDSVTDRLDYARCIHPGCIWEAGLRPIHPRSYVSVHRVDADRMNSHHHLSLARNQVRYFLKFHHLGSAELVYSYAFHGIS